jgi:hypothetical protein
VFRVTPQYSANSFSDNRIGFVMLSAIENPALYAFVYVGSLYANQQLVGRDDERKLNGEKIAEIASCVASVWRLCGVSVARVWQ